MGLLSLASNASTSRGYGYYKGNLVLYVEKIDDNEYEGQVQGSLHSPYNVRINTKHPRKSQCNCPHADGKRVICKHMVAMFFAVFPQEADDYITEIEDNERFEEERAKERYEEIKDYVYSLTIEQLRSVLISALTESNEDDEFYL